MHGGNTLNIFEASIEIFPNVTQSKNIHTQKHAYPPRSRFLPLSQMSACIQNYGIVKSPPSQQLQSRASTCKGIMRCFKCGLFRTPPMRIKQHRQMPCIMHPLNMHYMPFAVNAITSVLSCHPVVKKWNSHKGMESP